MFLLVLFLLVISFYQVHNKTRILEYFIQNFPCTNFWGLWGALKWNCKEQKTFANFLKVFKTRFLDYTFCSSSIRNWFSYVTFKVVLEYESKQRPSFTYRFAITGTIKDKIFTASGKDVRAYTKKGKLFLDFDTNLTEPIRSMSISGSHLLTYVQL